MIMDRAVREKPVFIRRTRDHLMLANLDFLEALVNNSKFTAKRWREKDGSITLSLDQIDIAVNAATEPEALVALAYDLREYATDYYEHFPQWSIAPNRKEHLPYVVKILVTDELGKIVEMIQCHDGAN